MSEASIAFTFLMVASSAVACLGGYRLGYRRGFRWSLDEQSIQTTEYLMQLMVMISPEAATEVAAAVKRKAIEDLEVVVAKLKAAKNG